MSVDVSGEITAIATAILAVFAIITGAFAVIAFRKQSLEVAILAAEDEREIRDRRRDQASRVFIWAEADAPPDPQDQAVRGLITHIRNTSNRPVYEGLIRFRNASGRIEDSPYTPAFPALMPGDQADSAHAFTEPVPVPVFWQDNSRLQATLRFRDAAGVHWQLGTDGQLDEIPPPGTANHPSHRA
jgi:hypothetical protein